MGVRILHLYHNYAGLLVRVRHTRTGSAGAAQEGCVLTPKLTDILARVPLDKLKQLAGATSIELLNSLKPQAVSQPGLAEFLVHTSGEAAALTDPAIRDTVIDHLHGPEAVEICQRLKAPTADPISTLRGAIKSPAKFEKFLTYFSLSLSSSFADEPVPASFRATPESTLRPHQTESYRRLRRALNPPNKKVPMSAASLDKSAASQIGETDESLME